MASCTTFASIVSIETYPLLQEFSHLTDRAISFVSPQSLGSARNKTWKRGSPE